MQLSAKGGDEILKILGEAEDRVWCKVFGL